MGEIPNDMKVNVRAVLLSQEGGVLVSQFIKDYKHLIQKTLPYKNHGFDNLEDFFKAMPDVVRLEYSKKDMAYRVYGIIDKNTYTPSWVEKSQKTQEERPKNRHHSVRSKSNGKSVPNGDDLIPDSRNRYSVVYPRSKTPDYTDNDVRERFKNTGNVCDVHMIEKWIFVRYRNQDDARRAQQMYKDELDVRFTDGNKGKSSKDNTANNSSMLSPETQSFDGSFGGSFGGGVGGSFVGASSARTPSNFVERKKNESFSEEKAKTTDSNTFQVYIGNLAKEVTEVDLVDIISGKPVTRVCIKRMNNGSKVVGFVSFTSQKDADDVIAKWNGTVWHGRDLLVRHGKQRQEGSKVSEFGSSKQSENKNNLPNSMNTARKKEKSDDEKSISSISDNFNKLHVNPTMKDSNDNNIQTSTPRQIVCTNGSSLKVTKNCPSPLFVPTQVSRQSSSSFKKNLHTDTEDTMPALEEMMPELEEMMPELEEMMPELEDIKSPIEDSTFSSNGYVDQPTAVFVGNFPAGTTDRELYALFNRYGVLQVKMVNNALNHERGCTKAFVTLEGLDCAVEAILDLDQTPYIDRKLLVSAPHGNEMLKEIIDSKLQEYMSDTGSSFCSSARTFSNRSKSTPPSTCQDVTNMSSQESAALLETFTHIMAKMTSRKPQPIEVGDEITLCVTSWLIEQFYFAQNGSDKHSVKELLDISRNIQNSENHLGRPRGLGRCVALYMGQWYRAWILKIDDQPKYGNVKVFYVDYGNVSIIPLSNTRVVHSSAWDLPAQAKPIRIMGETGFSEKELVEKQLSVTVTNLLTVDKCPVFEVTVSGIES
ncbi:uncharacterized protein LOC126817428 [Patella vulgata]|uniref:uncharacterized protein LOC126817428 n=1 Tax=Patella vulgata TaxID=6465 RepID=UPI0021801A75|nr:uncharacterized protein LOC126817428 [Patella vulgata]